MAGTTQSCAIVRPDILGSVLLAALVVVTPALGGAVPIATRPAVPGSERVLRLPVEYNIGTLSVRPRRIREAKRMGSTTGGKMRIGNRSARCAEKSSFPPASKSACTSMGDRSHR